MENKLNSSQKAMEDKLNHIENLIICTELTGLKII